MSDEQVDPSDDSDEAGALRARLATDAVGALVHQLDPGTLANKFLLIIETVTVDGRPGVWTLTPDNAPIHELMGLVEYARARHQAAVTLMMLDKG
jgi:hypothetical protein